MTFPESTDFLKPCLYEGVITAFDYNNPGLCTVELLSGESVSASFRYGGQNAVWNWPNPGNQYQYSHNAFCLNDVVLVVGIKDTEGQKYTVVAAMKEDRSELLKRWNWPLFDRSKSVIGKLTYTDEGGAGYGFPFIASTSTRALVNHFTDLNGHERALGTKNGSDQYLVISRERISDEFDEEWIPHAAHEFMTQADNFEFLPDISGRIEPNYQGRVIGVSKDGKLLLDNIHFATIGTVEGAPNGSAMGTSRTVVNVLPETGTIAISYVTIDMNAFANGTDGYAATYPFHIATATYQLDLCLHEIMRPDFSPPTINLVSRPDLSVHQDDTRWWQGLFPGVDEFSAGYRMCGHYDNLLAGDIAVGGYNAEFKLTVNFSDIFEDGSNYHCVYTYSVDFDETGQISTSFSRALDTAGMCGKYNVGRFNTGTITYPGVFNFDGSASIPAGTCQFFVSEYGGHKMTSEVVHSWNANETVTAARDEWICNPSMTVYYISGHSGSNVFDFSIDYSWDGIPVASFWCAGSSSWSKSAIRVQDQCEPTFTSHLEISGSTSANYNIFMPIFLEADVRNGIFIYVQCRLNDNLNLSTLYAGSSDYINSQPIQYDLILNNRGEETLLHTFEYFSPAGDTASFTTQQDLDLDMYLFFVNKGLSPPRLDQYPGQHLLLNQFESIERSTFWMPDIMLGNEGETSNWFSAGDITEFWLTTKYNTFSKHPFDRAKWPTPRCVSGASMDYYDWGAGTSSPLNSPYLNWIMLAKGYVTREGSSSVNAYRYSYTINIGAWTGIAVAQSPGYDDILLCTGRTDAVLTLE